MPFVKQDDGTLVWVDPTAANVKVVEAEISEALFGKPNVTYQEKVKAQQEEQTKDPRPLFTGSNNSINTALANIASQGVQPVDIILPIYGSIHIASKCIDAVLRRTNWPYNLIIVDDASDSPTREYLKTRKFPDNVRVIFNNKNRGFAATVNRGMKESKNPYICFLNSDVLVTPNWLTKMVMALESNPKNQIINPITNNTALINVDMQQGHSYLDMNRALEATTQRSYPEVMPTGFCFLFKRELIWKIGFLDEAYKNYGEETDYWMKVITYLENGYYMKYRAALADDTYLFHERGSSFGAMGEYAHLSLRRGSNDRFHRVWPQYAQWIKGHNANKTMAPFRAPFPEKIITNRDSDYKICWVVRSAAMCGGMKYITDVVNEINERGGDAKIALVHRKKGTPVTTLTELRTAPIIFDSDNDFEKNFSRRVFKSGIVVAAISETAYLVSKICQNNSRLVGVNHVQSYDPAIAPDANTKAIAHKSYELLPHTIVNSKQIEQILKKDHKVSPMATISPGVDRMLFYPRGREQGDDRPTILLSLNRAYPFKGADRGVALAKEIWMLFSKAGVDIRIMAYGVEVVPTAPFIICQGPVSQVRLANLLSTEVDIFVDPSSYHSYGLPALEAMASGVPVVSWDNGGIGEFGKDGENCRIFANDKSPKEVAQGIFDLLSDAELREKLARNALTKTVPDHDRATSVHEFISTLETGLKLSYPKRKIVFITPHLRKYGGPTTIIKAANELAKRGHDVSISVIYTDINPDVSLQSKVPINVDIQNIPACDVLFVNSDNPDSKFFSNLPQAKHKILYKLSHNPRFQDLETASLKEKWSKIVTTSDWLAEACKNPQKGWKHPSREAERVGWFHYAHGTFNCHPTKRQYGSKATSIIISTLIHHHELKGTKEVIAVLDKLRRKYTMEVVGIGEVPPDKVKHPDWLTYVYAPSRAKMADIFRQTDIWVGASRTEGLGRLGLESMSAGVACVLSDTGPEYAKHEENCLLYPIGDSAAMEASIERLIEDKELFKKIVINAYETADLYSDSTEFVQNLEKVIYELCQK